MRRRELLKLGGAALVPATLLDHGRASAAERAMQPGGRRLTQIGLQLSTVTRLLMQDFEGTLRQVAGIGYTLVEFSAMGLLGRPVEPVKQLMAEIGLQAPLGRVSPKLPADVMQMPREEAMRVFAERGQAKYLVENVQHALEDAQAFGQKIINLPALPPTEFTSLDQVKASIEAINTAGEVCAAQGVQFGYHNHDWELTPIDGIIPYDLMIEQTDPGNVSFQLDSYWIVKAGGNLSDYLSRYSGRFNSCHLKDIDEHGDFEDVGHGSIDFPRFVAEAEAAGVRYFFVERDDPPDPADAIQRSYDYLRDMTY